MDEMILTPAVAIAPVSHPSQNRLSVWLPRIAILLLLLVIVGVAGRWGLRYRRWMWDTSVPIRLVRDTQHTDLDHAYARGRTSAAAGYLNQYEKMRWQKPGAKTWLEDPPLRLAVLTLWGRWSLNHFPKVDVWHKDGSYTLTAPLLGFNLLMESIGVVSAFFLARIWAIRGMLVLADRDSLRWFFRGCLPGTLAALLLWFNPAMVMSDYAWPTGDGWLVSMFLLAALLATVDWWFTAGIVLGIGVMLNVPLVIALPIFILWPIFLFQPYFVARFCAGFVLAVGLILSPWMITGGPAIFWLSGVLVAAGGMPFVSWLTLKRPASMEPKKSFPVIVRLRQWLELPWAWRGIAGFTAFALIVWPWLLHRNREEWMSGVVTAGAATCAVLWVRPRGIAVLSAGCVGAALLLCVPLFGASTAWYDCSFVFPTEHWKTLTVGLTDNLPGILQRNYHWRANDLNATFFTISASTILDYPAVDIDVTLQQFLLRLFAYGLVIAAVGTGMQARRRDPRVLIALTAPWLAFYCFLPQMPERYLLMGAGISCICTGVSLGMTLLGIFLSMASVVMMLQALLVAANPPARQAFADLLTRQFLGGSSPEGGQKMLDTLNGTSGMGYAIVLCGLIFLYYSIARRRRWPVQSASLGI